MTIVTAEIVRQVARLARLRLEGKELDHLARQINEILEYVRQLQDIPTDEVEPTSHVLPLSNVLRKDERQPSLSQEIVMAIAPQKQPPFVKVPKIIDDASR
ncbi:MAG: Asp-tRNA(Asn)/Glu-tRNA(Gln) amidotransferase subunit GatC [Candidatus Omnitrophica bacterium]|nr:Asp-tRNA(Asn)/Glu-tRNA(Gln) amidotransferase subunit GatC [Candidatus Omnitrophota bacterium]MBI3010036.1 Asp-tRNA(Asn)/Glu-tRNA(Gln) amidotransferase subunit GatC [Candidatus Omnitrophota bacterium]